MINSNAYDYINILDRTADASWTRNEVIGNNIANVNTPGYKRQDIDFETQLRQSLGDSRYISMDTKVRNSLKDDLRPRLYYDHINYSYRLDGNNVDIDTENMELAANQLKYQGIIAGIKSEFNNLQSVMKST
ncbi:MAG: flagellar basal body rod protein FlgB [Lachnospiraceae bacterium]|nr:flagellar basal body rod protein FlgB [Lachnospiraceae bacterium]